MSPSKSNVYSDLDEMGDSESSAQLSVCPHWLKTVTLKWANRNEVVLSAPWNKKALDNKMTDLNDIS